MPSPLFLGLDLSTQQLKAVILSEDGLVVHESAVNFDRDLPSYGATNGAKHGPGEGEVSSPVEMWIAAVDMLMQNMRAKGVVFGDIVAVSGAGQQHGSVYWSSEADQLLSNLNPSQSLTHQLVPKAFTLLDCPIWQDSSTTRECQELEEAVGGPQALADLSGSRAYERFTGPHIAKIRREKPEIYESTAHISLVSSFVPSLFLGKIAPIEVSDASGMNLTNVFTGKWEESLLEACGGSSLRKKLGPEPVPGGTVLGPVSDWWVKKWGFDPDCIVAPFTGDNPATMVALSSPGDAILSLGTSTTLLLSVPPSDTHPQRFTTSHLLSHPTTPNAQVAMLCYKNGALAREQIRDRFADHHWTKFNELVERSPVGNSGYLALYFPLPEIIPPNVLGEFYFKSDPNNTSASPSPISKIPDSAHPRAILESQFLSVRSRISAILPAHAPHLNRLVITGGSSANETIRQLAADIFDMKVCVVEGNKEGAGTGGALLAMFAWWRQANAGKGTFEEMMAGLENVGDERVKVVATPNELAAKVYEGLLEQYSACEEQVVKMCTK